MNFYLNHCLLKTVPKAIALLLLVLLGIPICEADSNEDRGGADQPQTWWAFRPLSDAEPPLGSGPRRSGAK